MNLIGDFNINLANYGAHSDTSNYVDLLLQNEFLPLITLPTRITERSATVLDHISTTHQDTSYNTGIIIESISDHFPVFFTRNLKRNKPLNSNPQKTRIFNEKNINNFKDKLSNSNWNEILDQKNPTLAFNNFFDIINTNFNNSFPELSITKNRRTTPSEPWMNADILLKRKIKNKLFTKMKRSGSADLINKYKSFNNQYTFLCRQTKIQYYKEKFKTHEKNIKKTWDIINNVLGKCKSKDSLPNYFISNNNILSDNFEIAQGFNDFFANIGPELAAKISNTETSYKDYLGPETNTRFVFANMTEELILDATKSLKTKHSSGPDGISTYLLKEIIQIIARPLAYIFNLSFKTGYIPIEFKTARIKPIYKSGNKHEFNNYRPISLLSTFSKLLEKIAASQMTKYLNKFNLLYKFQFGFRKKHSTILPMLHFLDKIFNDQNKSSPNFTLAIFIDLKKAFDTCNFDILLNKLKHYGFRGRSQMWFESYLKGRVQYTEYNGIKSDLRFLETGVPQGSVLGPLLFLILINDLANCSEKFLTLLFADDTTFQLSGANIYELYSLANNELAKAAEWFRVNKLTLNISKTKYMLFRKTKENLDTSLSLCLNIDGTQIEQIGDDCKEKYFKFVGLRIDENLTWKYQIQHVRGKLASANYAISKTKNFLPKAAKLTLYNSIFKSHMDYGLLCWGGVPPSFTKPLFQIQKKCIRNIAGANSRAHTDCLFNELQILKIHDLYELQAACLAFNTVYRKGPQSSNSLFKPLQGARSRDLLTAMPNAKKLQPFPSVMIPKIWNGLSMGLKRSCDILMLKTNLKSLKFSEYNSN